MVNDKQQRDVYLLKETVQLQINTFSLLKILHQKLFLSDSIEKVWHFSNELVHISLVFFRISFLYIIFFSFMTYQPLLYASLKISLTSILSIHNTFENNSGGLFNKIFNCWLGSAQYCLKHCLNKKLWLKNNHQNSHNVSFLQLQHK